MPEALNKQYQNYTCADMSRYLKKNHQHEPMTSIGEAVIDYVQGYLLKDKTW